MKKIYMVMMIFLANVYLMRASAPKVTTAKTTGKSASTMGTKLQNAKNSVSSFMEQSVAYAKQTGSKVKTAAKQATGIGMNKVNKQQREQLQEGGSIVSGGKKTGLTLRNKSLKSTSPLKNEGLALAEAPVKPANSVAKNSGEGLALTKTSSESAPMLLLKNEAEFKPLEYKARDAQSSSNPQLEINGTLRTINSKQQKVLDKIAARKQAELDVKPKLEREILLNENGTAGQTITVKTKKDGSQSTRKVEAEIAKDANGNQYTKYTRADGSKYTNVLVNNQALVGPKAQSATGPVVEAIGKGATRITNADGSYQTFTPVTKPGILRSRATNEVKMEGFTKDGVLLEHNRTQTRTLSKQEYTKKLDVIKAEKEALDYQAQPKVELSVVEQQSLNNAAMKAKGFKAGSSEFNPEAPQVGKARFMLRETGRGMKEFGQAIKSTDFSKPVKYVRRQAGKLAKGISQNVPVGVRLKTNAELAANQAPTKSGEFIIPEPGQSKYKAYSLNDAISDVKNYNSRSASNQRWEAKESAIIKAERNAITSEKAQGQATALKNKIELQQARALKKAQLEATKGDVVTIPDGFFA